MVVVPAEPSLIGAELDVQEVLYDRGWEWVECPVQDKLMMAWEGRERQ